MRLASMALSVSCPYCSSSNSSWVSPFWSLHLANPGLSPVTALSPSLLSSDLSRSAWVTSPFVLSGVASSSPLSLVCSALSPQLLQQHYSHSPLQGTTLLGAHPSSAVLFGGKTSLFQDHSTPVIDYPAQLRGWQFSSSFSASRSLCSLQVDQTQLLRQ